MKLYCLCFVLLGSIVPGALGHGRLRKPPSRSSMWRDGFGNPANYNDHELNCGGFWRQWKKNEGKCGICGDPFDGVRANEAGGRYANGIITKTYEEGGYINTTVEITADHKGWFEFRVCPNNDITTPATQECLDRYLLPLADGSGTRYEMPQPRGNYHYVLLKLPQGLTCEQCVFQWKWHAGNNWGNDPTTGCVGLGCGPQEEFYGCADVKIVSANGNEGEGEPEDGPGDDSTESPSSVQPGNTPERETPAHTERHDGPSDDGNQKPRMVCRGAGLYAHRGGMDQWCETNCKVGYCPPSHCRCETQNDPPTTTPQPPQPTEEARPSACTVYKAKGSYSNDDAINDYCRTTCPFRHCSEVYCTCASGSGAEAVVCVPEEKYEHIDGFDTYCASACQFRSTCKGCSCMEP